MRELDSNLIKNAIEKLCIDSNYYLNDDIKKGIKDAIKIETSDLSVHVLEKLLENAHIASNERIAICQDTGMAVVFVELGQDVHIVGDLLEDAINEGVRLGYSKGYLRSSIVIDPINRVNTNDNTPAIIHYNIVKGDKVKISVAPKGFGSENMSCLYMLKPSDGIEGVRKVIIETVKKAGSNPCPPIIVGVGIGGTIEKACLIAKEALMRNIDTNNQNEFWHNEEVYLLNEINKLNIGVAGFGGVTTALSVNINTYPTHIAGLPVAVNIGCNVTRHKTMTI